MTVYRGVEVTPRSFLILALSEAGQLYAPVSLHPVNEILPHKKEAAGSQSQTEKLQRRDVTCYYWESNRDFSDVQPIAYPLRYSESKAINTESVNNKKYL